MRPRKRVLLYGGDEQALELAAFALNLRDFMVQVATDECDFVRAFETLAPQGVVFFPDRPADELLRFVRKCGSDTTTLLIQKRAKDHLADGALVMPNKLDMAELRYAVRLAVGRKRGPKKRAVSVPPADAEERAA